MASVWDELKRRNVVKVAVAYAIVGWVLIEISSTVFPIVQLPSWTITLVTMLLLLGFPVAIILSWVYELTPEGVERTGPVPESESVAKGTSKKLEFVIIGALVLALAIVAYNYVLVDGDQVVAITGSPEPAVEQVPIVLQNSVAVLPFENLSSDPENAFFAAGIHEETLNELAKLRNLSVISRTSVLRYANSDKSIPEIANELNVETVLEGSVRYAAGRVRITAQLIEARTDEHLWSEVYERDFADIFAIQSDIAMNIANAMQAEFSLEEQAHLEKVPTNSPEAYALYLRVVSNRPQNSSTNAERAAAFDLLHRAIAFDPEFALPYVELARLNLVYGEILTHGLERSRELALANANKALELDPTLGSAYVQIARSYVFARDGSNARAALDKAQEISPNDPDVLMSRANFEAVAGNTDKAIDLAERASALGQTNGLGLVLILTGQHDRAVEWYEARAKEDPSNPILYIELGRLAAARGDYEGAVAQLRIVDRMMQAVPGDGGYILAYAYGLAGRREDASRVVDHMNQVAVGRDLPSMLLALGYLGTGENARALEQLELSFDDPSIAFLNVEAALMLVNAFADPVLDQPEFVEVRKRLGFQNVNNE